MSRTHIYLAIQKTNNMTVPQWDQLISLVDQLTGTTENPGNRLQKRTNLAGDAIIYEANFDTDHISFENFRKKLVNAFGVQDSKVTYTTDATTKFLNKNTVIATAKYNGTNMFVLALLGATSDTGFPSYEESRQETVEYLRQNLIDWE